MVEPDIESIRKQAVEVSKEGKGGGQRAFTKFDEGKRIIKKLLDEKGEAFALPKQTVSDIFGYVGGADINTRRGYHSFIWLLNGRKPKGGIIEGRLLDNGIKAETSHGRDYIAFGYVQDPWRRK